MHSISLPASNPWQLQRDFLGCARSALTTMLCNHYYNVHNYGAVQVSVVLATFEQVRVDRPKSHIIFCINKYGRPKKDVHGRGSTVTLWRAIALPLCVMMAYFCITP